MSAAIEVLHYIQLNGIFKDKKKARASLSAIGVVGNFLLVAGDEGNQIQILKANGKNFELQPESKPVKLNDDDEIEVDIEGIAVDGDTVYALGSHSAKRKKLDPQESRKENLERLLTIEKKTTSRDVLARFKLSADGKATEIDATKSLRQVLNSQPVLQPFLKVPCKENGVDIEGLAVKGDKLFVGFRGPVLNGGYVPILTTQFGAATGDVIYANFDGRGVRDLEAVKDGFLVLAGPTGDVGGFRLLWWDGRDMLPNGNGNAEIGRIIELGTIDPPMGGKAEGLTVEPNDDPNSYQILVVFDGVDGGGALRLKVRKLR